MKLKRRMLGIGVVLSGLVLAAVGIAVASTGSQRVDQTPLALSSVVAKQAASVQPSAGAATLRRIRRPIVPASWRLTLPHSTGPPGRSATAGTLALGLHRGGQGSFSSQSFAVSEEWTGYVSGKLVLIWVGETPKDGAESPSGPPTVKIYRDPPISSARPPTLAKVMTFSGVGLATFASTPSGAQLAIRLPDGRTARPNVVAIVNGS